MTLLIITFIFGLGLSFFSTQNTSPVTITLAGTQYQAIPLYMVVVGSVLLGLFIAWIIHVIDSLFSSMEMHGKNSALRKSSSTINQLEEKIHDLELENARLKGENNEPIVVEHSEHTPRPGFLSSLRNRLSF